MLSMYRLVPNMNDNSLCHLKVKSSIGTENNKEMLIHLPNVSENELI